MRHMMTFYTFNLVRHNSQLARDHQDYWSAKRAARIYPQQATRIETFWEHLRHSNRGLMFANLTLDALFLKDGKELLDNVIGVHWRI